MPAWVQHVAFGVCCLACGAGFVTCWLLWRSRENWKVAAKSWRPQRTARARTQRLAHLEDTIELTDEDLIDDE